MLRLLQTFVEIAVWRKGPQDLPASSSLLCVTAAIYVAAMFVQTRLMGYSAPVTTVITVVDVSMQCLWLIGILGLFGFRTRFAQTMTAVLGVGILLALLDIAFQLIARSIGDPLVTQRMALTELMITMLVIGHILTVAIERGLLTGMAVTLGIVLSIATIADLIIKPAVPV